jgi:hypothetical protein
MNVWRTEFLYVALGQKCSIKLNIWKILNKFKKSEHIYISLNKELTMVKNIFAGKSTRIIRVLLSTPSKTWRVRELASEANVSLGLVSIVTNRLINMGFLVRDRSMRLKLRKGEELLRRWASFYDPDMWPRKVYYGRGTLYEIGRNLAETAKRYDLKYAFTGPFATDLLTQYIRPAEIHMYVTGEGALRKITDDLNLEIAEIGGNVIFLITNDNSVFYGLRDMTDNKVGAVSVVSDVQLILDLFNYTDRTREAAERLLTKEFERKSREVNTIELVKRYFEQEGLVAEQVQTAVFGPRLDIILLDPETHEYTVVECKNSIAKLDSVDQLKRAVSFFGEKAKGLLVAPSITNAAMKELKRAKLEFKSVEAVKRGLYKGAG